MPASVHRQGASREDVDGLTLTDHIPEDHFLRSLDGFVELSDIRRQLEPYYSPIGRPSIDPELMIRMLLIGYCCGIRSERRLCQEVSLNLAYRWFCRLDKKAFAGCKDSAGSRAIRYFVLQNEGSGCIVYALVPAAAGSDAAHPPEVNDAQYQVAAIKAAFAK